jgi:hypothetical protein
LWSNVNLEGERIILVGVMEEVWVRILRYVVSGFPHGDDVGVRNSAKPSAVMK